MAGEQPEKSEETPKTEVNIGKVSGIRGVVNVAGGNLTQLIVNLPRWLLILGAVAIVVGTLSGVFYLAPLVRNIVPTPLPLEPEGAGEILIVIATFRRSEGIPDAEIHNEIRRALADSLPADLNMRVEVEPTVLAAEDREGAQALGERYNASMLIWGSDSGVRVTVNFLNLKQPDFVVADVEITETERTQRANPAAYASFVTEDLPTRLAFLSLFAAGNSYYIAEDYPAALETIDAALAALPPDMPAPTEVVAAYNIRGLAYAALGEVEAALADYNRAIQIDPDFADVYNNRGNAYYDLDEFDAALADYNRAIQIDPDFAGAYNNRGIVYEALGDFDIAIADYTRAIELDPDNAIGYYNRGLAYEVLSDYQTAIADYTAAIEIDPDYADAYNNRGTLYYELGDSDAALADYIRAIELNPDDAIHYYNRGLAYEVLGDYQTAIADYTAAIEIDPDDADAYNNRGNAYDSLGEYQTAIADYNRAIELDPDDAFAYYNRGLTYDNLDDPEAALADYRRFLELASGLAPDDEFRTYVEQRIAELEAELSTPTP